MNIKTAFDLISDFFLWHKLRNIQKNRLVQSSYIWLVIVPVSAKLFSKISDTITFSIGEFQYQFDMVLPFSWVLFYFAALFFTIGNVLFVVFAPQIIKENEDYGGFESAGRGYSHLIDYIKEDVDRGKLNQKKAGGRQIDHSFEFWHIYNSRTNESYCVRGLTGMLYVLGLVLFIYVGVQNLLWILKSLIS